MHHFFCIKNLLVQPPPLFTPNFTPTIRITKDTKNLKKYNKKNKKMSFFEQKIIVLFNLKF